MNESQVLVTVVGGLVLTGILWLLRTANETARDVAVIRALAERSSIEIERLRSGLHTLRTYVQAIETRVAVLESEGTK